MEAATTGTKGGLQIKAVEVIKTVSASILKMNAKTT